MTFLDHAESRLGRLAIPGLIRYIVLLNALVYLLGRLTGGAYIGALEMNPTAIWSGEVWRLVTWIFIPLQFSPLWILFYLLFLWFLGDVLESAWGAFRTTLFYFTGAFACTIAALFLGNLGANAFLNLSLLLAVGTVAPDLQILLLFVIPVRIKWVALAYFVLLVLGSIGLPPGDQLAIAISLGNYILFFGPALVRRMADRRTTLIRRAKFEAAKLGDDTLHRCSVCGRTEASDPDLDFRVTSDGTEYCTEHLPRR